MEALERVSLTVSYFFLGPIRDRLLLKEPKPLM